MRLKFGLLLIFFCASIVNAQDDLSGNLIFTPYPSPYLSDWETNPTSLGQLTIINNNGSTDDVRVRAIVTKQDRGEVFRSVTNPIPLNGSPVQDVDNTTLISFSDASYSDDEFRRIVQMTGRLLEGEYTVCLTIEKLTGGMSATGICSDFTIQYPDAPRLMSPDDEENISTPTPYPNFEWVPVIVPPAYEIKYTFRIVEILPTQNPFEAITSNYPIYEDNQIRTNTFLYPIEAPELINGKTYAWQIQALDQYGFPPTQNQGKSEIFSFTINGTSGSGGGITIDYPANNDTIPWNYFPIIHKFEPYSDEYFSENIEFELFEEGTSLYTRPRELSWPYGPELSQEDALGGIDILQEESQYLPINRRLNETPVPPNFRRGKDYTWNADISIDDRSTTRLSGTLNGNFSVGMGKPILRQPPNNDTISPGNVNLLFTTSNSPSKLAPKFSILQSGGHAANFFNGAVHERWVLELSRNRDMSSASMVGDSIINPSIDLNQAIENQGAAIAAIYSDETRPYNATDTGWYYWRVKWLEDPDNISSDAYRYSDIYRFYIGARDTSRHETTTTPGSCMADCEAPPIPDAQKVPVTSAAVGAYLHIGLFILNVTEITWSGQSASGHGTIDVPFLRAPIRVAFNNIRVNADNKIYEGDVHAEYDNEGIIPANLLSPVGSITGMSDSEVEALNSYVNQAAHLVSAFTSSTPVGMPIGLDHMIDDRRYTIAVVGLNFKPEHAELNAMVALDFPELHGWIGLGAREICFHPDGLGGLGRGMLYLPADKDEFWSDDITLKLKGTKFSSDYSAVTDSGTFVRWDCSGFISLTISGEVIFGNNLLVEDLDDGQPELTKLKLNLK